MIAALRRIPPLEGSLLAVAVIVLIVLGVLKNGSDQAQSPVYETYSSFDANGGGYRAFYELLAREGLRVERFEQRAAFLEPGGTLVYAEPLPFDPDQIPVSKGDVDALEHWVRAGGHLVYLGHDDDAARAGVLHLPASCSKACWGGGRPRPVSPPGVARLDVSSALRWKLGRGTKLGSRTRVLLADRRGAIAVTYPFGKGRVTALIDETLLRNDGIAHGDRARFAYGLVAGDAGADEPVAFDETVHGHIVPLHWWSIVPRPFLIALCVALAALLVAFAGAAVRLGPPLLPAARDDRTSADFIDALSSLLARGGAVRKALTDAANSASRVVARGLGLDDGASNEQIGARIEREDLRTAFFEMHAVAANGFPNEENLVRGVALAQRLRKEYAAHGRTRH
jgi:hypothetical protein